MSTRASSTSAGRCRPASPCSRRAPAPARRTRSPRSRRATSPRARRSTSCCSSRSRGWRPASCASASASGCVARAGLARLDGGRPTTRSSAAGDADASAARGSPARWPTSTPPRSPPRTASARRCSSGLGVAGDVERDAPVRRGRHRPGRGGRRRPLRAPLPPRRGRAGVRREQAGKIARAAVANPLARIEPAHADEGSVPAMRARLADAVREELERRKRALASSPTTTCSRACTTTLDGPGGEPSRSGCAAATRSCSSTSSRTPTRCSGTSCGARSREAARSC